MWKIRLSAFLLLLCASGIGFWVYASERGWGGVSNNFPFVLGLDLKGGAHLVYRADVSRLSAADVDDSMESLRDVIERRVNLFGVSEPLVQIERKSLLTGSPEERLIVELPGITRLDEAIAMIGATPVLEFKLLKEDVKLNSAGEPENPSEAFELTGLTGRFLSRASLEFDPTTAEPEVSLQFNDEGKTLFANLTRAHTGRILAIFLDGAVISAPVIREAIPDGRAQISGSFTPEEARSLVRNLNYGALPVPIALISTETIGASLGEEAVQKSVWAGLWGFGIIALFLLFWYRLPGALSVLALSMYAVITLSLFKLIPVTLTAAGLAGFILSLGMAVDANILIFERMKEELRKGKNLEEAVREGFVRAWASIRDSNLSSLITAVILYWLGTTSVIKGFALVFGLGVMVSMFTAITASRVFLLALTLGSRGGRLRGFLFGNGLNL